MSDGTKIEWTDATWNPVRGCTKITAGCTHCYAATFAERFRGVPGHPYEQGFDLRLDEAGRRRWSHDGDILRQAVALRCVEHRESFEERDRGGFGFG